MADLRAITLPGPTVELRGALDLDRSERGVVPRRLPAWTRMRLPDVNTEYVVQCGAGVRIAFATNARLLELDVLTHRIAMESVPLSPPAFDLRIDGSFLATAYATHGAVTTVHLNGGIVEQPGAVDTLRFQLDSRWHEVEIWLDLAAVTELRGLRADGEVRAPEPIAVRRWVHHGSSISHCAHASSPRHAWPTRVAADAGVELTNLGFSGNAQLDGFVAQTIADLPADLISLKIGINIVDGDTMRERTYLAALHSFLDTIRSGHPRTPILLISPIHCPLLEDHPGPLRWVVADGSVGPEIVERSELLSHGALTLQRVRELNDEVVRKRQDPALTYLSGLELLATDDAACLSDALHPDDEGFALMADRFLRFAFERGGPFAEG